MEISGDVTDAGRTDDDDKQGKIGLLSQMDAGWLSFAICMTIISHFFPEFVCPQEVCLFVCFFEDDESGVKARPLDDIADGRCGV